MGILFQNSEYGGKSQENSSGIMLLLNLILSISRNGIQLNGIIYIRAYENIEKYTIRNNIFKISNIICNYFNLHNEK